MSNEEKIYLDQKGYEKYLLSIENLKEKLKKVSAGRRNAFDAGAGDGWDSPEFEEIERQERQINGELQEKYRNLQRIVIIEKSDNEDIVDIGDTISVGLVFSSDDKDELTFKLVGDIANMRTPIKEISVNSPLGASVYKKKVGDSSFYMINNSKVEVFIKEKISLIKDDNDIVKKKVKQ